MKKSTALEAPLISPQERSASPKMRSISPPHIIKRGKHCILNLIPHPPMDEAPSYYVLISCVGREPSISIHRQRVESDIALGLPDLLGYPRERRFLLEQFPREATESTRLLLTRHCAHFGHWSKDHRMSINAHATIALETVGISMPKPCRGNVVVLAHNEDDPAIPYMLTRDDALSIQRRMRTALFTKHRSTDGARSHSSRSPSPLSQQPFSIFEKDDDDNSTSSDTDDELYSPPLRPASPLLPSTVE